MEILHRLFLTRAMQKMKRGNLMDPMGTTWWTVALHYNHEEADESVIGQLAVSP